MDLKETLNQAITMNHLAELAVEQLAKLKKEGKPIIQICGPMSTGGMGNLENNMARFKYAVDKATAEGLLVFNQLPFQDAMIRITNYTSGAPYAMDILEVFYKSLFESGNINKLLFLPDWQSSKGATWEHEFAKKLGIPVEEYPAEWLTGFNLTVQ